LLLRPLLNGGTLGRPAMLRTLSSAQTFLMKFVFPLVWLSGFATGTTAMFLTDAQATRDNLDSTGAPQSRAQPPPPEMKWGFLAMTLAGAAFLYWGCMRLKRVAISGDSLVISNYLTTIQVPLSELDRVTENRWINIHPVTLHFRRPTAFGTRVVFMPKVRWLGLFFSSHPVVDDIRAAVAMKPYAAQQAIEADDRTSS
jgi:hypothetical protein